MRAPGKRAAPIFGNLTHNATQPDMINLKYAITTHFWRYSKLVIISLLLVACIDEVQLPIRQAQRRLVVDGLITDEAPPYAIKLTYSGNLTSQLLIPEELTVNGAVVTISDDAGHSVRLEQDPLAPAYYWMRDRTFQGKAGRAYTLTVSTPDGEVFVSDPEPMPAVAPIEKVYAEYRRQNTPVLLPDLYDVMIDTKDPATAGNYYRWSTYGYVPRWSGYTPFDEIPPGPSRPCCTSCWVPYYGPLTDVLSDVLVNGNTISRHKVFSSPVYAIGKQFIETRQYSLTRGAYQYWNRFEEQRSRSGSLFDAQPASIEGNIHLKDDPNTLALGYFGASSVSSKRLIIPADTINATKFISRFGRTFLSENKNCLQAYPQGQLAPPINW